METTEVPVGDAGPAQEPDILASLDRLITITDRIRLGSFITIVGVAGAFVGLVTGQLTYLEFTGAIGASGVGGGVIGIARNGAGHGVK